MTWLFMVKWVIAHETFYLPMIPAHSFKSSFLIWWNMISNIFAIINVILLMSGTLMDGKLRSRKTLITWGCRTRLFGMIKYCRFRLWVCQGFTIYILWSFFWKSNLHSPWNALKRFQDLTKNTFASFPVMLLWDYSWSHSSVNLCKPIMLRNYYEETLRIFWIAFY